MKSLVLVVAVGIVIGIYGFMFYRSLIRYSTVPVRPGDCPVLKEHRVFNSLDSLIWETWIGNTCELQVGHKGGHKFE